MIKRMIPLTVIAGLFAIAGSGMAEARGGNHGCSPQEGTFYSDDAWDGGDNVIGGFRTEELTMAGDKDVLYAQNQESGSDQQVALSCQDEPGGWSLFQSRLGAGDDTVRLDAKGILSDDDYEPLPKSIDSELSGGAGADTLRGHKGFDDISGGGGSDVVKADDGKRDVVACGGGTDKADVDSKDDVSGCEKTT